MTDFMSKTDTSIANALGIFSPALTLALFTIISVSRGGKLQTETAFTTMAILSMVTHPANMVMTIMPRAVAAFSGFDRIQAFFLRQSLQDERGILPRTVQNGLAGNLTSGYSAKQSPVIQICQLRIGQKDLVLKDVNIEVAAESFTIVSGPTGSGKSALLRAVLGEVAPVHGSIALSTLRIAYCAQKPWLPNGSIKEAIYGATGTYDLGDQDHDEWYHEVVTACCLTYDFDSLPNGDQTQIGSRGLNLSGGQRQRMVCFSGFLSPELIDKC